VSRSAGDVGFKGTKKSTPFAASKVVEAVMNELPPVQIDEAQILIKGIGAGRDSALRTLVSHDINIAEIRDVTPIPFNGPRPPKTRRV